LYRCDQGHRFAKRHGYQGNVNAHDARREPEWRPCVKMIQPISLTAAVGRCTSRIQLTRSLKAPGVE
jgi:hypothetical protein